MTLHYHQDYQCVKCDAFFLPYQSPVTVCPECGEPNLQGEEFREIIEVLHKDGVAILLVEQNVPLTLAASQRVYIMEKGQMRHHCAASEIKVDDPLIKQYLGV